MDAAPQLLHAGVMGESIISAALTGRALRPIDPAIQRKNSDTVHPERVVGFARASTSSAQTELMASLGRICLQEADSFLRRPRTSQPSTGSFMYSSSPVSQ